MNRLSWNRVSWCFQLLAKKRATTREQIVRKYDHFLHNLLPLGKKKCSTPLYQTKEKTLFSNCFFFTTSILRSKHAPRQGVLRHIGHSIYKVCQFNRSPPLPNTRSHRFNQHFQFSSLKVLNQDGCLNGLILNKECSQPPNDALKGHLGVYIGETDKKWLVIRISYLNHPFFPDLLNWEEEGYGFDSPMGGLTIWHREGYFINLTSILSYLKLTEHQVPKTILPLMALQDTEASLHNFALQAPEMNVHGLTTNLCADSINMKPLMKPDLSLPVKETNYSSSQA
ncbi:Small auxin-up RNA [Dillenia turbinata]|uniref:Small auxin-up RNA n=1 Tax=Dillenia turbinata TaxID=194707 RepID=A0AAN8UM92_9MAGN